MKLRGFFPALALAVTMSLPLAAVGATTTAPAGAHFHALMNQMLDSGTAQVGQHFTMQLVAPYPNDDVSTWAGSTLTAHIVHVQHASQGRKAELGFVFDKITLRNGAAAHISANLVSVEEKHGSNLGHAALTTLGGMVVGNILGKWLGTNAGGAVGAVGGALYGINQKTNFTIAAGSKVDLTLTLPLTVVKP
jgi:hypothetical protein